MTNAFPKLLTVLGAAAFLFAAPLSAQNTGTGGGEAGATAGGGAGGGGADVYPSQDMDERVSPLKHQMGETFRGLGTRAPATDVTFDPTIGATVPDNVTRSPVPDEIIAISPETRGYEYVTLADGTIVLVHPEDNTIATVIGQQ